MPNPTPTNNRLQASVRNVDEQLYGFISVLYEDIRPLGFREYTYLLDDIKSRKVTKLNLLQYALLKLAVEEHLNTRRARYVLRKRIPSRARGKSLTLFTEKEVHKAYDDYCCRGGKKGLREFISSRWFDSEKFFGKPIK